MSVTSGANDTQLSDNTGSGNPAPETVESTIAELESAVQDATSTTENKLKVGLENLITFNTSPY